MGGQKKRKVFRRGKNAADHIESRQNYKMQASEAKLDLREEIGFRTGRQVREGVRDGLEYLGRQAGHRRRAGAGVWAQTFEQE